jgi:polyketide cyclase/dehydrase/lipid transport protein
MKTTASSPNATDLTSAALRHRLRLELRAPVPDVWALVGQHVRMPEYSAGIASVEIESASDGSRARVCQFRSPDGAGLGPKLRERIRWEAPEGYATSADPGNAFGLENSLELVTVASAPAGTILTWEEYYDSQDLPAARASFDDGLADIARRLVDRFGGRILERYTDVPA